MKLPVTRILSIFLAACLILTACLPSPPPTGDAIPFDGRPPSAGETPPGETTDLPAPTPSATAEPIPRVWLPPYLPEDLRNSLTLPTGWQTAEQETGADAVFDVLIVPVDGSKAPADAVPWVYALAAPFATLADEVTGEALVARWRGLEAPGLTGISLLVDESTRAVFTRLWGEPGSTVETAQADQMLARAQETKSAWAILPFERLEPRWKVIAVDGQSPVQKSFQLNAYPLAAYFALLDAENTPLSAEDGDTRPPAPSNRQPDRLTTVMLTGVTALVRGTASLMETLGMEYPATDIGDLLREADILHINNEIPFASDCPFPFPWEGLKFCSQTEYITLLEAIGTDVVEFSGDHLQDWGLDAITLTLDMYEEKGWPTYGGGRNLEDAYVPATFEHNGNRIAFLGCSAKLEGYSSASADTPGAVHCDMDRLVAEIGHVREEGYLPVVTFQHLEYLTYEIHPALQADFRRVADAGAVIVSGSQAHQPHAMEFYAPPGADSPGFLHYGLGNLFFDQLKEGFPNRQAFIDRHVFYEGRHISTELLTILFIDYARARPMTPEERLDLLSTIFKASGW